MESQRLNRSWKTKVKHRVTNVNISCTCTEELIVAEAVTRVPTTALKAINRGLQSLNPATRLSQFVLRLLTFELNNPKVHVFLSSKQLSKLKSVEFAQRNEEAKSREKQRI